MTEMDQNLTSTLSTIGQIPLSSDTDNPVLHKLKEVPIGQGTSSKSTEVKTSIHDSAHDPIKDSGQFSALSKAYQHRTDVITKYENIHTMTQQNKIQALKDMRLNPGLIKDPYDALANSLERWKNMANSPEAAKLSPEKQQVAAKHYYENMLAPMYKAMGVDPIPEEDWLKHAYGEAKKFDIEKAYGTHWRQGVFEGFKDWENTLKFGMTSIVGGNIEGLKLWKGIVNAARGKTDDDFVANVEKELKSIHEKGVFGTLREDTEKTPIASEMYHTLDRVSKEDGFWHDILPPDSKMDRAKSWVAEQTMMLPFWGAAGKFTRAGIAALGSENLTKYLATKTSGKLLTDLLTGGSEGTAYGLATRDDGDKANWWQDALGAAIGNTIFHVGGKSVRSATEAASKLAQKVELGKAGFKEGTAESLREPVVLGTAGTLAAGGRMLNHSVDEEAIKLLRDGEGKIPGELAKLRQQRLKEDPARWKRVYEKAAYIKRFLAGKKVSELNENETALLVKELHDISNDAAERVHEVPAVAQESATKSNNSKGKEITLQNIMQKEMAKDRDAGRPQRPVSDYKALAEYEMNQRAARAERLAARKKADKSVQEAIDVHERRVEAQKSAPRMETKRSVNKFGEPSVSFKANTDFIAYFKNAVKASGEKWDSVGIKKFLEDMQPEDFEKDLYDHFFPKELKDMGMFFENQNEAGLGRQNPNFLAFMYNYTDQMPKEFGEKLSQELEDRMKFEKNFDKKIGVEEQKEYYAKGMWNHVADFLHSPSFEGGERNVFRTTLKDLKTPTKWQMQLWNERGMQEREFIKQMFTGNPSGYKDAMTAYNALSSFRATAEVTGDVEGKKEAIEGIDSILTRTGDREKVKF